MILGGNILGKVGNLLGDPRCTEIPIQRTHHLMDSAHVSQKVSRQVVISSRRHIWLRKKGFGI